MYFATIENILKTNRKQELKKKKKRDRGEGEPQEFQGGASGEEEGKSEKSGFTEGFKERC